MRVIPTADLSPRTPLNPDDASWVYNGLDCCVTLEIKQELTRQLAESPANVQQTYQDSMDKLAPIIEMSLRGFKIDTKARDQAIAELSNTLATVQANFDRLCVEGLGLPCNWRSPLQLKRLFYGTLGIKEVKARNQRGVYTATTNRKALEKIAATNMIGQVFANHILKMRDLGKALGFLKSEIDEDGRIRSSYNPAGTNTGRLSSSINEFGTGTNLQNVASALRYPFIADEGFIQVNMDLEQADARNLGALIYVNALLEDKEFAAGYLDACESGDLHTTVCRMAWSELAWPEDKEGWRAIADELAYRDFTYRDLAKRLGHGTNFYGQPKTMAIHTQTASNIIELFQAKYFKSFPGIPWYHKWVRTQLAESGQLTTLYGRRRFFFGRSTDDATLREAIAYSPQSMTAHEIDHAYLSIWRDPVLSSEVQLLNQVHDSINFQIPYDGHEELIPLIFKAAKCKLILPGDREFSVPLEAAVGYNWGYPKYDKQGNIISNPNGLIKWKGKADPRVPPKYLKNPRSLKALLK